MTKQSIYQFIIQKRVWISITFLYTIGALSCTQVSNTDYVLVYYPEPIRFDHVKTPAIDFNEVRERGTLRMITRYNSSSYFLHRGVDRGFEYDLVSQFAEEHGLKVEVVLIRPGDNPIEMLRRGEGDLIADNYSVSPERLPYVAFSKPYNLVDQVLVYGDMRTPIEDFSMLKDITITVRKNSSYYYTLRSLQEQGHDIHVDVVGEEWNTEALMLEVANGGIDATIAEENLYKAIASYIPGIHSGLVVSESDLIAWAVRKNAPELKQKIDEFITKHFRVSRFDDRISRSKYLSGLQRRYFEDHHQMGRLRDRSLDTFFSGYFSPYDEMVKSIAEEAGIDWKLVIAVMAQESGFNRHAESWAGALGLMQIIPRFSLVEKDSMLYNPEINIREGVRYLQEHLNRNAHLDSLNRYSLALATYNVGIGHITDARHLAEQLGNNPDEWENIADALLKLMNQKYYQHARYGFKRGTETVKYVEDVMNRYSRYNEVYNFAAHFDEKGREKLLQ